MWQPHAAWRPERLQQAFEGFDVVVEALVEFVPQHLSQRNVDDAAVEEKRGEQDHGGPGRERSSERREGGELTCGRLSQS